MLNTILVAIDESASSQWAFDTAIAMAKPLQAKLVLVHVLDAFSTNSPKHPCVLVETFSTDMGSSAQKAYEQKWQQFVDRHSALLKQRQSEAEAAGVSTSCIQTQGVPGPKICEIARTENIDLILVGNRDRTNQRELDHGSVSNYLVHHAPCSVTVVHPKADQESVLQSSSSKVAAAV